MHKDLPNFFTFIDQYNNKIFKNKNINIGIIYRNYGDRKRENQLIKIAKACKKNGFKLFVSNDVKLAHKFKADGIYIPSFNKKKRFFNLEKKDTIILGSAHNQKEISEKISQNCNAIFLSPIFYMKKYKNFLNLHKFNYLSKRNDINIYALGGISPKNIRKLKLLYINGFAGVRIYKKKPASLRPVLLKNNFF